jgi:integrase
MARPRRDGLPSREPNKRKLTESFINSLAPDPARSFLVWDTKVGGLALAVYPNGRKVWKTIYPFGGRTRWYTVGRADVIELSDARKLAAQVLLKVATDAQAERVAQRSRGTFEELAIKYVEQYAKKKNKSWKQADALVRRHLLPRWAKLRAESITRSDVKAMKASIAGPVVANQTLAAASAIFNWAIREEIVKVNPCKLVERNPTRSRERVLSESEIPKFWQAFDDAGLASRSRR